MPTSSARRRAAGKTDNVDTFRRKKKSPPHTHTRSRASLLRYYNIIIIYFILITSHERGTLYVYNVYIYYK